MITTDALLIELFQQGIEKLGSQIPNRDKKILISLSKQITAGHFLTENQSKLLIKIFTENLEVINNKVVNAQQPIEFPTWSQSFRVIEQVRKIFIAKEDNSRILVEFTYNKRLRQQISDLNKSVEGQMLAVNSKQYSIPLTEKNLHLVVNAFKNQGFEIDHILMEFYGEILEILKTINTQFNVFSLTDKKLEAAVVNEVGGITEDNLILLNDRRQKFQYSIFQKNPEISLKNALANRPGTRVWIDSTQTSLDDVVEAIGKLDRLPLLVIFNGHESKECLKNLEKLAISLKNCGVDTNSGIYFRFDNISEHNKNFNNLISQLGYNAQLTDTTLVAGIANNKLPKFLLKSKWYPKSVISFSNNFKSNKTSVYCDAVDLIVYYNEKRPLGGADAIV
jgi:hypothetical protein